MLRGAKSQGKFPGLSMELSRPYLDLVLRTLANEAARTKLRTAVRDEDEELLPFEFSYDALPFSIALAVARIKGGESARSEQYVRLVLEALHTLAPQIRAAAPPYQIAKYIIDESELRMLHAMSREAGDEEPFPEFLKSPCRWSLLLDAIFVPRGVKIFMATNSIMAEVSAVTQNQPAKVESKPATLSGSHARGAKAPKGRERPQREPTTSNSGAGRPRLVAAAHRP